ncbi:MAG: PaeR7I family type II restriction endonuclease [Deltaproteobacteria bacterium]|nr:PaeR7I family type II restriction endonuclease [Deltaproteobacteria bacterium]MCZ6563350.1 PaeR7I family type II restriction endonuclease [Deltaproteobacteria bacterium]
MTYAMGELQQKLAAAVEHFWKTRKRQESKQRARGGKRDRGSRSAVTGGAQLDGFIRLVKDLLADSGIPDAAIFVKRKTTELPGFFRPTKQWDLIVVVDGNLLASIEFKSHVGPSFGNNYNNRIEEALGNATDLWTAYREGVFGEAPRPWVGYLMLLEDAPQSNSAVEVDEPHFRVVEQFRGASYAKRYEQFCVKLVRERLYDAACFLMSDRVNGLKGGFKEPSREVSFTNFAASLTGRAVAYARIRSGRSG